MVHAVGRASFGSGVYLAWWMGGVLRRDVEGFRVGGMLLLLLCAGEVANWGKMEVGVGAKAVWNAVDFCGDGFVVDC